MNTHILNEFDEIYHDLSKLSADNIYSKNRISSLGLDRFRHDQLNFKDDKPKDQSFHEYFFKPFKDTQPETYMILSEVTEDFFYGIERSSIPEILSDATAFGININGIIVYLRYTPYIADDAQENEFNLPIEIIQSWLWHSAGWYIPEDAIYGPLAPSGLPSSNNRPIGSICPDIEGKNKKAHKKVVFLEEKFQQPLLVDYEDDASYETHFQLRTLIDTRFNGLEQEKNFQIFSVTNHIQKDIYLIQDQDIYSIQKLIKPAEAIDHYAAHLLSRQAGEFDFLQYTEDF